MAVERVAQVPLPTPYGTFDAHAFACRDGLVYLALTAGQLAGASGVLARVHSECLTGDVLGSLRCDCGVQLRTALRAVAAEGTGVVVYATGQEGRGIGLVSKLRAYVEQDRGADTVDANLHLGLPVDSRRYDDAAAVLNALGVRSVRLLSNNPLKVAGLEEAGVEVDSVLPLATSMHTRNAGYLATKRARLGHVDQPGGPPERVEGGSIDVRSLLGKVRPTPARPYVALKYAQSVDGRIATATGDSRWISGEAERRLSHALRAACDAVMVGAGTVVSDDPLLTVRLVDGASPRRVVVDSRLGIPLDAAILGAEAATTVFTTPGANLFKRLALEEMHVAVREVHACEDGVDLEEALCALRADGVSSLLVEGGARLITSLLARGLVDRLIVSVAPLLLGSGTEGVGDLGTRRVREGVRLDHRLVHLIDRDVVMTWDVVSGVRDRLVDDALEATPGQAG